jgi:hypothetical protein
LFIPAHEARERGREAMQTTYGFRSTLPHPRTITLDRAPGTTQPSQYGTRNTVPHPLTRETTRSSAPERTLRQPATSNRAVGFRGFNNAAEWHVKEIRRGRIPHQ